MTTQRLGPFRCVRATVELSLDPDAAATYADLLGDALTALACDGEASTTIRVEHDEGRWTIGVTGGPPGGPAPTSVGTSESVALHRLLSTFDNVAARSAAEVGWAVLHGGLVELDGQTIAAVAPSGTGKSTFTAFAVAGGHRFLGDEVVAVDPETGIVVPYRRPIGLRSGAAERLAITIPPGPFSAVYPYRPETEPEPDPPTRHLDEIVLLDRRPELAGTEVAVEAVTPASALLRFANQTLGPTGGEPEMFARIDRLVRRVPVVEVHYAEADDAIAAIRDRRERTAS